MKKYLLILLTLKLGLLHAQSIDIAHIGKGMHWIIQDIANDLTTFNNKTITLEFSVLNARSTTSLTDVYIKKGFDIFEIETKAGINFFENVANSTSKFAKQSFNSLKNVTKLENYKVFLNPSIRSQLDNAAYLATKKNDVIRAWTNWEGGAIYELPGIKQKFEIFAVSKGFDFETGTIKDFLIQNDDWFNLIFRTDL